MTTEDDMPWRAPWTERRGAQDEEAFVADVSAALYVPDAAPEIRMFAEVMAVLDIPAPRESTVNRRLAEERARREAAANVIPLRRLAFARSAAAVGVAAAIGLGLVTVSAYAGVLPDSIQKMAHSVINAPQPDHHGTPSGGGANNGNNGTSGNDPTSTTANGGHASHPAASAAASASSNAAVPTPGSTHTHTNSPNPHSTTSPTPGGSQGGNHGGGKNHKSPPASPTTTPNVDSTQSGSTSHHHG